METKEIASNTYEISYSDAEIREGDILNLMSFFNLTEDEVIEDWSVWKRIDIETWVYRDNGVNDKFIYNNNLYKNKNNDIISFDRDSCIKYVYECLANDMFKELVNPNFKEEYKSLISMDLFDRLSEEFSFYDARINPRGFWDTPYYKEEASIDGYGNIDFTYILLRNPLKEIDPLSYTGPSGCSRLITLPGLNESGMANTKWLEQPSDV